MNILYVYEGNSNNLTGLGETFLREMNKNKEINIIPFKFLSLTRNKYFNKFFQVLGVNKLYLNKQNNQLLKSVFNKNPDVVFVFKGAGLYANVLKKIKLKRKNIKIATFNPDDPFNSKSCKQNIVDAVPLNDFYFIWSMALVRKIKNLGVNSVHYIPFATDTDIVSTPIFEGFKYDITFVGNGDEERLKWIKEIRDMINFSGMKIKLDVFGKKWPNIDGVQIHKGVEGFAYFNVLRHSKVSINILRLQNKNSLNMRTFEIPAAGGIMFHEESKEAEFFFTKDDPVYFFSSPKEFLSKLSFLLENLDEVQKSTSNLVNKFMEYNYTYSARINKILECLKQ